MIAAASFAKLPFPGMLKLESVEILKSLTRAHRYLVELKGAAKTMPNEVILITTLTMQEAKDSSEIENIIPTHDELFRLDVLKEEKVNQAAKEVENYRVALREGYKKTQSLGLIRLSDTYFNNVGAHSIH